MRRAFTLLEILVAGTLMSVIFFVLVNLYPSSIVSLRKGHDLIGATNVGQQVLDTQLSTPFDQVVVGTQTLPDQTIGATPYHVTLVVGSPRSTLKDLRVTVSWSLDEAVSPSQSVTLQTTMYRFQNP